MRDVMRDSMQRAIPRSAVAAAVFGWSGGVIAWLIGYMFTDGMFSGGAPLINTVTRVDAVVACMFGGSVGGMVMLARARHRREPLFPAFAQGLVAGGVPALLAATATMWLANDTENVAFVIARMLAWGSVAACTSVGLSIASRESSTTLALESLALGAIGGAIGGAIVSLPGPSELWLPAGLAWSGAAIGMSSMGPLLWRAHILVRVQPPRGERGGMWSLYERTIARGSTLAIGEVRVAHTPGAVVVHPPAGGATLDGYPMYRPVPLKRDALLQVGRARYRFTLGQTS